MELLKLPLRMISALCFRFSDLVKYRAVDEDAIRVPTFYAPPIKSHQYPWKTVTIIVAMLFGCIHCAGWNFPFPSHAELIIWRVSSLITLIVPCNFVVAVVVAAMDVEDTILGTIINVVSLFGIVIYILARLTLFVEAFIALRHLPPGAYAVVEWTALLLHM